MATEESKQEVALEEKDGGLEENKVPDDGEEKENLDQESDKVPVGAGQQALFESFDAAQIDNLRKKIRIAFEMFDKDKSEAIGQEEVSTIMRYLGQYPSERDIVTKVLPQMLGTSFPESIEEFVTPIESTLESKENGGFGESKEDNDEEDRPVPYNQFCSWMMLYMLQDCFAPDSEDVIVSAFKTLDQEKKGYIEEEYLRQAMCKMGSPFRDNEFEAFVSAIKDPETGRLYYLEYVSNLTSQISEHKRRLDKSGD